MADIDVRITGADKLTEVGKRLKAAGDKGLRKEFLAGMQRAGAPLKAEAQASARTHLPHRGGLAAEAAGSGFSVRTRTAGRSVGVRVVAKGRKVRALGALDRGRLRHPVYGNRNVWVTQHIAPGWFTGALTRHADVVQAQMLAAMDATLKKI